MVPRFHKKPGASFSGLAKYLHHDVGHAKTAERVAWTHTLNLANDHVPSAVDEMLWTFRNAELLKAEAGVHAGGSVVERPVKHVSLNWHASEKPGREEMIKAAQSFLEKLRWHEHQCIIFCHTDRPHPHIHLVISMIHPETGRCLDASFERRHASAWAKAYEQERGRVFCEQRLLPVEQREASPPRPVWELLQQGLQAHMRAETARMAEAPDAHEARIDAEKLEHRILKEIQKEERLGFFQQGRAAFKALRNDIYREVRKEFAPDWKAYYGMKQAGTDKAELAAFKKDLIARQKAALETRRDAACETLRLDRDKQYAQLLEEQKDARATLRTGQELHVSSIDTLQRMAEGLRSNTTSSPNTQEEWEARRTARRAARSPQAADRPFAWDTDQSLTAQERSARRWMQRVAEYESTTTAERGVPQEQKALLLFQERLARRAAGLPAKATAAKAKHSPEPEPDG